MGVSGEGIPMDGGMEGDVMRVWVQDSWQPPALLLENFRRCGVNLSDHRHRAESQVQSSFCAWKMHQSSTDGEPEKDRLRD